MAVIKFSKDKDFEYDIQGLVKAFLGNDINAGLVIECGFNFEKNAEDNKDKKYNTVVLYDNSGYRKEGKFYAASEDDGGRKETKNRLKRCLYDLLKNYTGKELEWGTLSGIRPAKIITSLGESGKNDEEIRDIMKREYYLSDKKIDKCIKVSGIERDVFSSIDYKNEYSVYIGIPFCPSTCLYCSFTSYNISAYEDKVEDYLNALDKELKLIKEINQNKKVTTVYIGGGTPTSLNEAMLEKLMNIIDKHCDVESLREFNVEAGRPDSITGEKLEVLKKHKVSRISINPQTFKDETLKIIGRKHLTKDFFEKFYMAKELGFNNINTDFILGLPNEDINDIRDNMEKLTEITPENVTIHSLALKRAARLNIFKDDYNEYSFVNNGEIMNLVDEYMDKMNLRPYYLYRQKNIAGNMENTGYAKPGHEGIYNMLIMEEKQSIYAAGAGGVTKLVKQNKEINRAVKTNKLSNSENIIQRVDSVKNVDIYLERLEELMDKKKKAAEDFFGNNESE